MADLNKNGIEDSQEFQTETPGQYDLRYAMSVLGLGPGYMGSQDNQFARPQQALNFVQDALYNSGVDLGSLLGISQAPTDPGNYEGYISDLASTYAQNPALRQALGSLSQGEDPVGVAKTVWEKAKGDESLMGYLPMTTDTFGNTAPATEASVQQLITNLATDMAKERRDRSAYEQKRSQFESYAQPQNAYDLIGRPEVSDVTSAYREQLGKRAPMTAAEGANPNSRAYQLANVTGTLGKTTPMQGSGMAKPALSFGANQMLGRMANYQVDKAKQTTRPSQMELDNRARLGAIYQLITGESL